MPVLDDGTYVLPAVQGEPSKVVVVYQGYGSGKKRVAIKVQK